MGESEASQYPRTYRLLPKRRFPVRTTCVTIYGERKRHAIHSAESGYPTCSIEICDSELRLFKRAPLTFTYNP